MAISTCDRASPATRRLKRSGCKEAPCWSTQRTGARRGACQASRRSRSTNTYSTWTASIHCKYPPQRQPGAPIIDSARSLRSNPVRSSPNSAPAGTRGIVSRSSRARLLLKALQDHGLMGRPSPSAQMTYPCQVRRCRRRRMHQTRLRLLLRQPLLQPRAPPSREALHPL